MNNINKNYLMENIWRRYIKNNKYSYIVNYVEKNIPYINYYEVLSFLTYSKIKKITNNPKELDILILEYKLKLVDNESNKSIFLEFLNKFISYVNNK